MKVIISESIFDTDDILYAFEDKKADNKVKIRFRGDTDRALWLNEVSISEFLDCMKHIHNLINNDITLVDLDVLLAFQRKEAERLAKKEEENSTFKPPANVGDEAEV